MNTSTASPIALPGTRSHSVLSSLIGATLLGLVIVFATGFSDVSAAHNAAHDMRHASTFPCH